jgi:ABC-type histidine transport system ATPase subunit
MTNPPGVEIGDLHKKYENEQVLYGIELKTTSQNKKFRKYDY